MLLWFFSSWNEFNLFKHCETRVKENKTILPVYSCSQAHCPRFSVTGKKVVVREQKNKMDEVDEPWPKKRKTETFSDSPHNVKI